MKLTAFSPNFERQPLKLSSVSTVVFFLLCLLLIVIESVFALPVLSLTVFAMQQPLFSDVERVSMALSCGVLLAVMYNIPLVVGMMIFCLLAAVQYLEFGKSRREVRDAVLVACGCGFIFAVSDQRSLELWSVLRFVCYFLSIIAAVRIWSRQRLKFLSERR